MPTPTAELPAATPVGPRGYLADTALAASAARRFLTVLGTAGPELTPVEARRQAPQLREAADDVGLAFQRLSAGRLDDRRLEEQRTRVTPALSRVSSIMDRMAIYASQGRAPQLVGLLPDLREAMAALRDATA